MHDKGYAHNDIKMENVLLETSNLQNFEKINVKLADFGFSQKI